MKTLENLKSRLLALPKDREGRKHESRYAAFFAKIIPAKERLERAVTVITHAALILPAPGYNDARKTIRSTIAIASRLREKLTAEPAAILEANVESSFTRLFENAEFGLRSCQTAWEMELQAKIKDWEAVAEVVAQLVRVEGARLKGAIDSIRAAKNKLPQTKKDVSQVQADLEELRDSVSKLGLQTAFGKFLQAAASPLGADLSAAHEHEVSQMIAKHKLEKVFRIRLSS
jgi:hypothetical protein